MATYTSGTKNGYYAKLYIKPSSQSITNNTTTLSYKLILYSGSNSFSGYTIGYQIYINGDRVAYHNNSGAQTSMSKNSSKTVKSGSKTVTHNSDGTKSVAVSFKIWTNNTSYLPVSLSKSGTFTCTTIPRASTMSCPSSFTCGSTGTVSISRKSSSFTHTASFNLGNTGMSATSGIATSFTYTPPYSLFDSYGSSTYRSGTMTVQTKSGSTNIGSALTKSVTVYLPQNAETKPTCTWGSNSFAEAGTSYYSKYGVLIAGKSKLSISGLSSSGKHGASISGNYFTLPGTSQASFSSGTLITNTLTTSSSKATFSYYVKDSRGFTSTTVTKANPFTVVNYTKPSIKSFSAERVNSSGEPDPTAGTNVKFAVSMNVDPIAIDTTTYSPNKGVVNIYQVTRNEDGSIKTNTLINTTSNLSSSTFTITKTDTTYDTATTYEFVATISDSETGETSVATSPTASISTAAAMISLYGNEGMAIGKIAEGPGLDINWDTTIRGVDFTITDSEYNELLNLLGGG